MEIRTKIGAVVLREKIDATLFELCLGILVYGVVFEGVLLCFSRKASYSIGLWSGVLAAVCAAVHMWVTLNRSMGTARKSAVAKVTANNIVRYLLLAGVAVLLMLTEIGNPLFAFFGYMGMKISAYISPLMRKLNVRFFKVGHYDRK